MSALLLKDYYVIFRQMKIFLLLILVFSCIPGTFYSTFAVVYVERESQKGIIIGKKGAAIKRIGTEARADLEQLLGTRVYLDLSVKVKKNWRRDATQIRRFGYGEGA